MRTMLGTYILCARNADGTWSEKFAVYSYNEELFIIKPSIFFRLPTRPQTPVIMIGPGTGVAPFRAFIQERDLAREEGS